MFYFSIIHYLNFRHGRIDSNLRETLKNSKSFLKSTKIERMDILKGLRGEGMVKQKFSLFVERF